MNQHSPSLERFRNPRGFSTILALLLTGFLVTLAAGILFLFLSENRTNQSLFSGAAAYHASEGALEYALLKIKNHREGFQDYLGLREDEGKVLAGNTSRNAQIGYEIVATGTSYTGTIAPDGFEIIPLFAEGGKVLKTEGGKPWKDPRNPLKLPTPAAFYNLVPTTDYEFSIMSGDRVVWNVIGNDTSGATYGISGVLYSTIPNPIPAGIQAQQGVVSGSAFGNFRQYDRGVLSEKTKTVQEFSGEYGENYLVLHNPGTTAIRYSVRSRNSTPFTLPKTQVLASGKVMDSVINLQMGEDRSRLYDILKYSLFVPE